MRSRPTPPVCKEGLKWIKLRCGKYVLAPLTGQDAPALQAFLHALELYCHSDMSGRRGAFIAMYGAVAAMQEKVRWIAREVIPHVLDWGDRDRLWPEIITGNGAFKALAWNTTEAMQAMAAAGNPQSNGGS
jgi:hypothetical protein